MKNNFSISYEEILNLVFVLLIYCCFKSTIKYFLRKFFLISLIKTTCLIVITLIEHTIRFVYLTLMITTTRATRDSNPRQRVLAAWPQIYFSNWNNDKYFHRRSNDVTTLQNIMNELWKLEYRLYIYSSRLMKYKTVI